MEVGKVEINGNGKRLDFTLGDGHMMQYAGNVFVELYT